MTAPRIAPGADEERALLRCAFRLLVGYVGGAIFAAGLQHLADSVGAAWQALALLTAGGAVAAGGIAAAWAALRDADGRAIGARHRQGLARRSAMADHNLGRRVG